MKPMIRFPYPRRSSVLFFSFLFIVIASASAKAATIVVPAGGDFQAALNAANFGDTIVLQAGATYTTQFGFKLPFKGAGSGTYSDYITILTSNLGPLPASNARLNPSVHISALAKLVSTAGYQVIDT